jgi:hypothetical protein
MEYQHGAFKVNRKNHAMARLRKAPIQPDIAPSVCCGAKKSLLEI